MNKQINKKGKKYKRIPRTKKKTNFEKKNLQDLNK